MASYAFLKASFKQTHWDNSSVHVRRFYGQAKKTNACILGMLVLTAVSPLSRAGALMSGTWARPPNWRALCVTTLVRKHPLTS